MTAFHASGGDVLWGTTRLSADTVSYLLDIYRIEYCTAFKAKDTVFAQRALDLHDELADAMTEQRRRARASGPFQSKENSRGL